MVKFTVVPSTPITRTSTGVVGAVLGRRA